MSSSYGQMNPKNISTLVNAVHAAQWEAVMMNLRVPHLLNISSKVHGTHVEEVRHTQRKRARDSDWEGGSERLRGRSDEVGRERGSKGGREGERGMWL
jgi:hypothetical protein